MRHGTFDKFGGSLPLSFTVNSADLLSKYVIDRPSLSRSVPFDNGFLPPNRTLGQNLAVMPITLQMEEGT
jgi:hypothetical protein